MDRLRAYTYDGNNLRVMKVAGGATTVYIFSGSKVIAEYDNGAAPASPSREYIYSGAALLAKIEGGASIYYHPDQLSNRVLTDSSGNTLGQRGHYPFGDTWYESGTTTKLQFTSYERDSESSNDYAMARSYINRFGRFSSPDPLTGSLGNPQSLNLYAYTENDPVNLVDPSGYHPTYAPGLDPSAFASWLFEVFVLGSDPNGDLLINPSTIDENGDPVQVDDPGAIFNPFLQGPTWEAAMSLGGPPRQPQSPCPFSSSSLDAYLKSKNSPMLGQGANFMNTGLKYDLDPRLLVALAGAETTFGKNITMGQYNALNVLYNGNNSPFSSFQANINAAAYSITNPRNGYNLSSTSTMYSTYCTGPGCAAGLNNLNLFMIQQNANPNAIHSPCK
ncbi:MAG TPA: RHS repeat-associated core domain-containing protein [Candidatus Acidoferrum sp.]|nr:RHS repeat-associated core domain-containing protein [Candidatus Acidoferrum sp.]